MKTTPTKRKPEEVPMTPEGGVDDRPFNPFLQLSPNKYIKTNKELGMVHKMTGDLPCEVFLVHVAYGLASLLYVNRYGSDEAAFSYPLTKACEARPGSANYNSNQVFLQEVGIIAFAPRRVSKQVNEPMYTAPNSTGGRYKKLLYILHIEDKSPANVRRVLERVKNFLVFEGIPCEVRRSLHVTDLSKQSLDHYIQDKYILRLHHLTFKKTVDGSFYEKNAAILTNAFFSEPYPPEAACLGYPVNSDIPLTPIPCTSATVEMNSTLSVSPPSTGDMIGKPSDNQDDTLTSDNQDDGQTSGNQDDPLQID